MAQDDNDALQAMEKMLLENAALAQKSRRMAVIGSAIIMAIIVVCGLFLYSHYANFDVKSLQDQLSVRAPNIIRPEINRLSTDMAQTLYPRIVQEVVKRTDLEQPLFQKELEKQMVILIGDLTKSFTARLEDETSMVVRDSIHTGVEGFELNSEQRDIINAFVEESVDYTLMHAHPLFQDYSKDAVAQMNNIYDTFYQLESTRLGKYIWPSSTEEATVNLLKGLLELAIIKLEQKPVQEMLKTDLRTDIKILPSINQEAGGGQ